MTDLEQQIMALEGRWWRTPGAKDEAIRTELGITPTRYYQLLARMLDREDVEAAHPVLVHRLRRIANGRRRVTPTMELDR